MNQLIAIDRLVAYIWRLIDRVDAQSHRHGDPDELLDELARLHSVIDDLEYRRELVEEVDGYDDESPWAVEARDRAALDRTKVDACYP